MLDRTAGVLNGFLDTDISFNKGLTSIRSQVPPVLPSRTSRPRALVVEFLKFHDEVLPSSVLALKDLGFQVDLMTTAENRAKDSFSQLDTKPDRAWTFSPVLRLLLKKGLPNILDRNYDLVVFNSVEPAVLLEVANRFHPNVVALVHNAKLVVKDPVFRETLRKGPTTLWGLTDFISGKYLGSSGKTLYPYYLGESPAAPPEGPVRFCVQGNFDYSRRNYDGLITALRQFKKEGRTGFQVDFVGDVKPRDMARFQADCAAEDLNEYVQFASGGLTYKDYFRVLGSNHYILPLIEPGIPNLQAYYDDSATSSVSMAVGLGVVPVIDRTLASLYRLDQGAVTYTPETGLYRAMAEAMEHSVRDRKAKVCRLMDLRAARLRQNTENFRAHLSR